jgi:hypothetical protein
MRTWVISARWRLKTGQWDLTEWSDKMGPNHWVDSGPFSEEPAIFQDYVCFVPKADIQLTRKSQSPSQF